MSADEKFLDRWSRRKREAADEPAPAAKAAEPPPHADAKTPAAELPFDPASLPPIESITAQTDIRAFLKPGVPPDLTRAALRRAWSADPEIRDFIGLVENGWDFNDPHGVPGFGPMPAGEDIARLLAQAIGGSARSESDARQQTASARGNSAENPPGAALSTPEQPSPPEPPPAPEHDSMQRSENSVAVQNDSEDRDGVPPARRHGHGGALPKL